MARLMTKVEMLKNRPSINRDSPKGHEVRHHDVTEDMNNVEMSELSELEGGAVGGISDSARKRLEGHKSNGHNMGADLRVVRGGSDYRTICGRIVEA